MCIRDRCGFYRKWGQDASDAGEKNGTQMMLISRLAADKKPYSCLLYTSDAADERSSVDLGGRRIIKKKTITTRKRKKVYITDAHKRHNV